MSVQPVNRSSGGVGFSLRQVIVEQITPNLAICKEVSSKHKMEVPLIPIRVRPPQVGEHWLLDQTFGFWSFAALLISFDQFVETGQSGLPGAPGDPGEPGEPGPPGDPGDVSFEFIQTTPDTTWDIYHTLPYTPSVLAVDSAGTVMEGNLTRIDATHLTYSFSVPVLGTAYCS